MITDLNEIKIIAQKKEKENYDFRLYLKMLDISDKELDLIVHKLTKDFMSKIECSKCNNCCKGPSPELSKEEINDIAKYRKITVIEFMNNFVKDRENPFDEYSLNSPCPFFRTNECEIKDVKPHLCASYPYLLNEDFRSRLFGVLSNYEICPIVFNVYEELKIMLWKKN